MIKSVVFIFMFCLILSWNYSYAQFYRRTMPKLETRTIVKKVEDNFKQGSEPDGFRNIKWGTDINTFTDMVLVRTNKINDRIKVYTKKSDELKWGEAELTKIEYSFWRDKFFKAEAYLKDDINWSKLKDAVFEVYGEGTGGKRKEGDMFRERYAYKGVKDYKEIYMNIEYSESLKTGTFTVALVKIAKQESVQYKYPTFKQGSEPDGFRNMKWGTDISTLKGMKPKGDLPNDKDIQVFIKEDDNLQFDAAKLQAVQYLFCKGKFVGYKLVAEGFMNYAAMQNQATKQFGEGNRISSKSQNVFWEGKTITVILTYNDTDKNETGYYSVRNNVVLKNLTNKDISDKIDFENYAKKDLPVTK